jgi:CheY-like chemotaxis protein
MQMPVMDGLTATAKIRDLEVENQRSRTPIIAFTANVMVHQVKSYIDAGMDAVVAKPIEFSKLIEAIETVLSEPDDESVCGDPSKMVA